MADNLADQQQTKRLHLTADWWAVIAALALAALVKFGALPHISW